MTRRGESPQTTERAARSVAEQSAADEGAKGIRVRRAACQGNGIDLKSALRAATAVLERRAEEINRLNVFPVPDGDTGTNMLLTMRAALQSAERVPDGSAAKVAEAAARGALMGARGNSGVILSQFFRGLAKVLANKDVFTCEDLATGFEEAATAAYAAVTKPVEGTMLTVGKDAAQAARNAAARDGTDLFEFLAKVTAEARASVARTTNLLPILRDAGVVDAGGLGVFVLLDGVYRFLRGESLDLTEPLPEAEAAPSVGEEVGYGYCTEFILRGEGLDLEAIKAKVVSLGDSVLVVGDENMVRVHVHTLEPGKVLGFATDKGTLHQIKIDNMQDQHHHFVFANVTSRTQPAVATGVSTVAVANSEGFVRVMMSLGLTAAVYGGTTMNPTSAELLKAVESTPTEKVIILPNNPNVIMTARQAAAMSKREVGIVATRTMPQGISALLAYNPEADLETNLRAMEEAANAVHSIEITRATRSVQWQGLEVREGQVIGLLEDQLVVAGEDEDDVVLRTLAKAPLADCELATVYYGERVPEETAQALARLIRQEHPKLTVEVVNGGQPLYNYVISAE